MVDPCDDDVKVSNTAPLYAKVSSEYQVLQVFRITQSNVDIFRITQSNFDKMLTDSTLYQNKNQCLGCVPRKIPGNKKGYLTILCPSIWSGHVDISDLN